jgi:hypothetical protein
MYPHEFQINTKLSIPIFSISFATQNCDWTCVNLGQPFTQLKDFKQVSWQ